MPTFNRQVYYEDYETEALVNVNVEWEEEFEVDVDDFYSSMDIVDKQQMFDALSEDHFRLSVSDYLKTLSDEESGELFDQFRNQLTQENDATYVYWPKSEQFVDHLSPAQRQELLDILNNRLVIQPVRMGVSEFWSKLNPTERLEMRQLTDGVSATSPLHTKVQNIIDAEDNQFHGLPDDMLIALKKRLERVVTPERATESTNPVLREIVNALKPNEPIDASLLYEMRLLAGSTSNAS